MPSQPTKTGTRKLSEVARKLVIPTGLASTGWPPVRDTCTLKLGITFDPWQDGAGRVILAKRADGKLAVMIGGVGMSLPRQVGKTYLIGAITFALCILNPGMLVIWSSHHARTHGETFLALQAFAGRIKVKPYVRQIFTGSGDEEIRFVNGSRILFGARERGFGRGIPGVDMIVSDEAQIMSDKALDAQLATMNTSKFGLAIYVGTPPRPDDPSEAFTRMRTEAWSGDLRDAAWIEFGADPDASPDDRKQWAIANPSYPHRTPVESILRLQRKLKPESFLREGLGVWDDGADALISLAQWQALSDLDAGMERDTPLAFAVAVSPDREWAAIGAAGRARGGSGKVHLEVVKGGHRPGVEWVVDRCVELKTKYRRVSFVLDDHGPASSLILDLTKARVKVVALKSGELADATEQFIDGVETGKYTHGPQSEVDEAIKGVKPRPLGDRLVFGRKKSTVEITALEALALAAYGASNYKRPTYVVDLNQLGAASGEDVAESPDQAAGPDPFDSGSDV